MADCQTSVESALTAAVDAVGTLQQVGHRLRPELDPTDAGRWLAHCLDPHHRQKLSYAQLRLIFRWAMESGDHAGFRMFAESAGYRIEPLDQQSEIVNLYRRSLRMSEQSKQLSDEALARMEAANINVEAIRA
jgi:hypothetical protein